MITLAIDPGTEHSGCVWLDGNTPVGMIYSNETLRDIIRFAAHEAAGYPVPDEIVIEMISSYGMPVGRETFETVYWIGRFFEAAATNYPPNKIGRLYRKDVKTYFCASSRAKDANVWMAVKDFYGGEAAVGRKKSPGPLYGIKSHCRQALALGMAWRNGVRSEGL